MLSTTAPKSPKIALKAARLALAMVLLFSPTNCLQAAEGEANPSSFSSQSPPKLSSEAGQYWREYDLRPYTEQLKQIDKPEQAIVDWILRETGTDVWFNAPMGMLNVSRSTLSVYHNDAMHETVKSVYERFVNGPNTAQAYSLKIITVGSVNWRTRATPWMKSVDVQSPGVQAWLLNKENASMLLAMLRGRSDAREANLPVLALHNGQSQSIEQLRARTYVREYTRQEQPYVAYIPSTKEILEGFRLQFSPLLSPDTKTLDVALKCSIDQVEKLNNVNIEIPSPNGGVQQAVINVPQVASWRLHERFRWQSDQVLVLSCGVVASPAPSNDGALLNNLGNNSPLFGMNRLVPNLSAPRVDALLFIEYKGPATSQVGLATGENTRSQESISPIASQPNTGNPISRGRY